MKKSLYLFQSGTLQRKDNTIRVITDQNVKRDFPIELYDTIYCFGEITVNSSLLSLFSQFGISIHFFNYYGFYTGSFYPKETNVSGQLLIKQAEYYSDDEKRLEIAQKFIDAATYNIYRNLRYYNSRGKDLQRYMDSINTLRNKIYETKSVNELMGYEGNIRQIYYDSWNIIINQDINFEKRVKNPPDNMINCLISYINTIVYTRTLAEIYKTPLNPTISYLHEPSTKRFSLCLDISEIFKPLIADRLIFSMLNKNQITTDGFTKELNFLRMKECTIKTITKELDDRFKKTIKHKDLNREVSYEYLMRLEMYKLIKHLYGEKKYDGFKIWW